MSIPLTTVPEPVKDDEFRVLTGNDYISLPEIDEFGRILSVTLLHSGCCGMVELRGDPFIAPTVSIDGESVDLVAMIPEMALESEWLPTFAWAGRVGVTAKIIAPPEEKGFCYVFTVSIPEECPLRQAHESDGRVQVELGVECNWEYTGVRILGSRPMPVTSTCRYDRWTRSVVAEAMASTPLVAFAGCTSADHSSADISTQPGSPDGIQDAHKIRLSSSVKLRPGEKADIAFYFAFNREEDGARTTSVHLRRLGWDQIYQLTMDWLDDRKATVLLDGDGAIDQAINRNLFFNYFYSSGKTIDTENLISLTSRSPRYYVSGAFWSRDALLWSFPALMITDVARAREVLHFAFAVGSRHPGDHAQYIDGRALYPGFELDEAAAYLIALGDYIDRTGDLGFMNLPGVMEGLDRVLDAIETWTYTDANGSVVLCGTFLDPSDDPVPMPFLTYCNVLVREAWLRAADLFERIGGEHRHRAAQLREDAKLLGESLMKYSVVDGVYGPMYAWAVDIEKVDGRIERTEYELSDIPPGSLELIGHYGFASDDYGAEVLANTRRWIHSEHNPHHYRGISSASGCAHAPFPWPMSIANSILAEVAEWNRTGVCDWDRLEKAICSLAHARMDQGYVCESVDEDTGKVVTGAAMATGAGFVAYALWLGSTALEKAGRLGPV